MDSLLQDIRVGWRSLWRAPAFACVVILILGLGIGANTMIFNIANAFLFRPWPYMDFQKNAVIYGVDPAHDEKGLELSFPDFVDVRARSKSFERIACYTETQAYMTLGKEPERFDATWVTPGLFAIYGATPQLGREFLPEEEVKSRALTVIMLSDRIWRERFGADPKILGRTVKMNGRIRRIVGIAPPEFRFPETADFFIPNYFEPHEESRAARYLDVVGRLKPGVSFKQANAEIAAIGADLAKQYPNSNKGTTLRVATYREAAAEDIGPMIAVMMAAVGFVLLIVCANVANLLLARGAGRRREVALRFALGATRGRIVRQLLTESLILSVLGGALGLLLAVWGRDLVLGSIPVELPFWMKFDTDLNTIVFMLGVSMLAAVLSGFTPALQTSHVDVHEALKDGGQHGSTSRSGRRLRSALVVAEISLALVLLAGAGLMIRSFLHQVEQKNTIQGKGVLTAAFTMPIAVYPNNAAKLAFMDRVMPALAALPGVRSISTTQILPLNRGAWSRLVWFEGDPEGADAPRRPVFWSVVRPGYFSTMGIPMRKGRDFNAQDDTASTKVVIVSQTAARTLWPNKEAIGQRFKWAVDDTMGWKTVVGVVGDVTQHIEGKKPPCHVYTPHQQEPLQTVTIVAKYDGDAAAMTAAMRRVVQSQDADMPLYDVRTMEEAIHRALWENRIWASLMTVFASLALIIAAVGIYGVMAYSVAQRTQEIGIRMALGAARNDVLRLVVTQAMRLTVIGVGIGLAGAYAVTRLMASVLFGVSATDPPTFIGVTVILGLSAVIAAWLPAERATRVDPMVALRSE
ncbi:MAG TPA: ABC transporter permease [Candidatus Eisenbacteria bacterium]|nr:ABC transporter permease [Candidatus Eisenbacteria bacterium]